MIPTITIEFTEKSIATLARLKAYPEAQMQSIARGQDAATKKITLSTIENRLTGRGPFPVSEHRLGRVTHYLATTTVAVPPVIEGRTVTTAIHTDASYAGVHEAGFDGEVHVRSYTRNRYKYGRKRTRRKTIGEIAVKAHDREMHIPARAPIHTGIAENIPQIQASINEALWEDWVAPL